MRRSLIRATAALGSAVVERHCRHGGYHPLEDKDTTSGIDCVPQRYGLRTSTQSAREDAVSGAPRSGEIAGARGQLPTVAEAAPLEQRSSSSAISPSCYLNVAARSLCGGKVARHWRTETPYGDLLCVLVRSRSGRKTRPSVCLGIVSGLRVPASPRQLEGCTTWSAVSSRGVRPGSQPGLVPSSSWTTWLLGRCLLCRSSFRTAVYKIRPQLAGLLCRCCKPP